LGWTAILALSPFAGLTPRPSPNQELVVGSFPPVVPFASSSTEAQARFDHLVSMSDDIGAFEHADHDKPRRAGGYRTDDMAHVLVVATRQPAPSRAVTDLGRTAFRFLADSQGVDGRVRPRRTETGHWEGKHEVGDCWGRSLWAFGTAAHRASRPALRQQALAYFGHGAEQRSPSSRAMAFAALGAAEVLATDPRHRRAHQILADAVTTIGPLAADADWPWPEPRLTYANAALAEALVAAGSLLARPDVQKDGLTLLRWLLDRETLDGHLSPTPAGGAGPADHAPGYDQQPLEVAAMADACARAAAVTGDPSWLAGVDLAARWFTGDNDAGTPLSDPATGAGYDGLHATGPDRNQGTASTVAVISTLQQAQRLAVAPVVYAN
jgi:hypothetical protein